MHEFLADWANFLAEGCTEHHDLLLMGGQFEDLLHIVTHVYQGNAMNKKITKCKI